MIRHGEKTEYTGGRTEVEIVNWILKRVGPPSTQVDCDKLKEKVEQSKLVAAFFGDSSSSQFNDVFIGATKDSTVGDKFSFVHISDSECAASFGASSPSVVLFRKFDNSPVVYSGAWDSSSLAQWLSTSSVPTLIEFSEEFIEPIFGHRKAAIFLFRSESDSNSAYAKVFADAAQTLKGEILFVVSGIHEGIQGRLAEFIGVDDSSLPTIRLLDPNENMKKFTFPGSTQSVTVDGLKSFIHDFKSGSLQAFLKSAEIPEDDGKALKTIVGKNFQDVVINSDKDVFIKFYAPWCGHCKKIAPAWEELAEELSKVSGLVIADFDATANEADGVDIKGFPTLKFYARGHKDAPLEFDGERDIDGFKNYLKDNSQAYKNHLEGKTEL